MHGQYMRQWQTRVRYISSGLVLHLHSTPRIALHWCICALVHWCNGTLVHWCNGALVQWYIGELLHWWIATNPSLSTPMQWFGQLVNVTDHECNWCIALYFKWPVAQLHEEPAKFLPSCALVFFAQKTHFEVLLRRQRQRQRQCHDW